MKRIVLSGFCIVAALVLLTAIAAGVQGDGDSQVPAISSDGMYVAFESVATNLVTGDTNARRDIFVRDRQNKKIYLISKNTTGIPADSHSYNPVISSDGRFVAFESEAANLVNGDTNARKDIFVRERKNGITTLVSKDTAGTLGDGASILPSISGDGRYVAFESPADNLVAGDTNVARDIFVRDRTLGTTTRVSKSTAGTEADGNSRNPSISSDGRYVAFESDATNLVAGDTNSAADIFVRDRTLGTTTLVSKSPAGDSGNGASYHPAVSPDGRYIAFESDADDLVAGDTNGEMDIFVRVRPTGSTSLVSKNTSGDLAESPSFRPVISENGKFVAFYSSATNLVSMDTNGANDVFVRDRSAGTTTRVSRNSGGIEGDRESVFPSISSGGRFVVFESDATNLVNDDTNAKRDIFLRDRQLGLTSLVSQS